MVSMMLAQASDRRNGKGQVQRNPAGLHLISAGRCLKNRRQLSFYGSGAQIPSGASPS